MRTIERATTFKRDYKREGKDPPRLAQRAVRLSKEAGVQFRRRVRLWLPWLLAFGQLPRYHQSRNLILRLGQRRFWGRVSIMEFRYP